MDHQYKVLYQVHHRPEGVLKKDIPNGWGGCDALVVGSIMYSDGGSSTGIVSLDGRTDKPMDDSELFKFWSILAHQLMESKTLGDGRRMLARSVFETVREVITGKKSNTQPPASE